MYRLLSILLSCVIISVYLTNYLYNVDDFRYESDLDIYKNEKYMDEDIFSDTEYFPVALFCEFNESLYYEDSYGSERTYGGERVHEGIDIFTVDNIPAQFPVISVCDGVVERMGWLELGGYRIGIRSNNDVYYYYAHLDRYDDNIHEGDEVIAGQILGYIGDTGYSKVEGTGGNFPVHLHFGIYINKDENEISLNPYRLLKELEKNILMYDF